MARTILTDVAVVGSGPAGGAAALALAECGARVLVFEKAPLPRYKTCGGGVVRRAVRLLPVDMAPALERHCHAAEMNLLDEGLHFQVSRAEPIVSMTMRARFDSLLLAAAVERGASVWSPCEVRELLPRKGGIEITSTTGSSFARFLILASGASSSLARKAGWRRAPRLIPALEYEVGVEAPLLRKFSGTARFDFGVVPYGYAWVFPKREHLSVGILSAAGGGVSLSKVLSGYMRRIGIDGQRAIERHGFGLPARPQEGPFARDRVLLAGDAAGLVDPLTGEGITYAILSGQLAARALLEEGFDPARVARAYNDALASEILPELRLARILARCIYGRSRIRSFLFRRCGQEFCEAVTEIITGRQTYRQMLRSLGNYARLFSSVSSLGRR